MTEPRFHAGLCVGGADWPYREMEDRSPAERLAFLQELGYGEARCARR